MTIVRLTGSPMTNKKVYLKEDLEPAVKDELIEYSKAQILGELASHIKLDESYIIGFNILPSVTIPNAEELHLSAIPIGALQISEDTLATKICEYFGVVDANKKLDFTMRLQKMLAGEAGEI